MIKKILNISCKKATFLSGKKDAGKLSLLDNLKLKLHYSICDGCQHFAKQTTLIGDNSKKLHQHFPDTLSEEKKAMMKKAMKDANS